MKRIIGCSGLIAVILLAGCERSPQKGSKASGAGSDQLARTEVGVVLGESENWGYLGLKILKVHEQQKVLDKAPWHEPGGDWIFLDCANPVALWHGCARGRWRASLGGGLAYVG